MISFVSMKRRMINGNKIHETKLGGRKLYIEVTGKLLESAWIVFISFVHGTYPKE